MTDAFFRMLEEPDNYLDHRLSMSTWRCVKDELNQRPSYDCHWVLVCELGVRPVPVSALASRCRKVGRMPLRSRQRSHDHQQGTQAAALLVERIRDNSRRHLNAAERVAHGDQRERGKSPTNHREELKSGHARHVEIGEDYIRSLFLNFDQCGKPVFRRSNGVANLSKPERQRLSN